eukprot:GHRR01012565.1.p1 GENE.GHRR01012565.1~~GHRR01012565.1.p1  ORF type:complete len:218 (+),score=31.06 GHRR01012565.1:57-656(+)
MSAAASMSLAFKPVCALHNRSLQQRPARLRAVPRVMANFHSYSAKTLHGSEVKLDQYKGKVVLVTNVACYCGLTNSNYRELVQLHQKYHDKGLEILAWPCNQFGAQEPGTPAQITSFVTDKFGAEFTFMVHPVLLGQPQLPTLFACDVDSPSLCCTQVWQHSSKHKHMELHVLPQPSYSSLQIAVSSRQIAYVLQQYAM